METLLIMLTFHLLTVLLPYQTAGLIIPGKHKKPRKFRNRLGIEMVDLTGGRFQMGITDRDGRNGETPPYFTQVKPFQMDKYPVTNRQFLDFTKSRPNFVTDAESRGWSHVFLGYLNETQIDRHQHHQPSNHEPWMVPLQGATWYTPFGAGSDVLGDRMRHPVVHISKRDAHAYCFWADGKRLPTEYEWEYAARGGLNGVEYPWGDAYRMGKVNIWQGHFPYNDSGRDGYRGTSPVDAFPAQNKYDLYDMIGNVWEWTSTPWHIRYHTIKGTEHNYILKGASHLDSRKGHVGEKTRTSTRTHRLLHYSAGNVGFRCAKSIIVPKKKKKNRAPKIIKARSYFVHSEL